jgi:ATP-dependent Lhr-like helicase
LLDRAARTMLHVSLDRITPMAVPVLIMIGREMVPPGAAEDELLIQAEALAEEAMRVE